VGVEIGAVQEAHVIARQQRQVVLRSQFDGGVVEVFFARALRAGQLQVQAIGQRGLPLPQPVVRVLLATGGQALPQRTFATGQCDETAIVGQQPVRTHGYKVATVSFKKGAR
jgi:hypothetical protein